VEVDSVVRVSVEVATSTDEEVATIPCMDEVASMIPDVVVD
jgi:hypothetical protein